MNLSLSGVVPGLEMSSLGLSRLMLASYIITSERVYCDTMFRVEYYESC
ncbi:hypothetical protein [uncultured Christiangramia sp.]|nr:hypothetical protein [uncultured Christiangramia sp.]